MIKMIEERNAAQLACRRKPPRDVEVIWGRSRIARRVLMNGDDRCRMREKRGFTGHGIPPEHLPHVFERFYRAATSATATSGSGLGLAIVKRIVEVHRGTIDVESELHKGATFTITLPLSTPI